MTEPADTRTVDELVAAGVCVQCRKNPAVDPWAYQILCEKCEMEEWT